MICYFREILLYRRKTIRYTPHNFQIILPNKDVQVNQRLKLFAEIDIITIFATYFVNYASDFSVASRKLLHFCHNNGMINDLFGFEMRYVKEKIVHNTGPCFVVCIIDLYFRDNCWHYNHSYLQCSAFPVLTNYVYRVDSVVFNCYVNSSYWLLVICLLILFIIDSRADITLMD